MQSPSILHQSRPRAFQTAAIAAAYAAWLSSQHLLETTRGAIHGFTDHIHGALSAVNIFLNAHPAFANIVLAVSSFEVDLAAASMVVFFFLRRESRPLLALWFTLIMRQLCQASVSIPAPDGMIWHYPGFPSILVTYNTSTDFFFSGHMAVATLLAAELTVQRAPFWKRATAWGVTCIQAFIILSMRFHYVTDVVAGFLAAVVATQLASALGSRLDERFALWSLPASECAGKAAPGLAHSAASSGPDAPAGTLPLKVRGDGGRERV